MLTCYYIGYFEIIIESLDPGGNHPSYTGKQICLTATAQQKFATASSRRLTCHKKACQVNILKMDFFGRFDSRAIAVS